ncbi:MAG: hypothetical protein ABIK43_03425 [candidate division WOR-3 bacterium]
MGGNKLSGVTASAAHAAGLPDNVRTGTRVHAPDREHSRCVRSADDLAAVTGTCSEESLFSGVEGTETAWEQRTLLAFTHSFFCIWSYCNNMPGCALA